MWPVLRTRPVTNVPAQASIGGYGMGALSGLGGYMTLGLTAKAKPLLMTLGNDTAFVIKDGIGYFIGADGKTIKGTEMEYPAPPEDIAYINPHIFALLPPNTVPIPAAADAGSNAQPTFNPAQVVQIRSSMSLSLSQSISLPFSSEGTSPTPSQTLRMLSSSGTSKTTLFAVTVPSDKVTAASEGHTIWRFDMQPWSTQVDELIEQSLYTEALTLLDNLDKTQLPDKESRQALAKSLSAVAEFKAGKYDSAINVFITLDINPARVVALFPEVISGRLSVPRSGWVQLFGGPKTSGDPETSSENPADFKRSVETLLRYLSDRRPQVTGALAAVRITPSQSHQFPFLSATSVEDLFALPNAPYAALTPEQLLVRPGLLAPLCRIDNWCEVSEVEEVLQEHEKFSELIFLYNGRKMHSKALALLRKLSAKVKDEEEKLTPTIAYLQKLGPEHLELIFESSRWVFQEDPHMAFQIFTSDEHDLPRSAVADFLEEIDPSTCAHYLEYLISDCNENSTLFHDRLAELYLEMTQGARRRAETEEEKNCYAKLINFIQTSTHYRTDRLFGLLPSEGLFEARAILLGRLGRHEAALEVYVYRLKDYLAAERYCKFMYRPDSPEKHIFLSLLRIFLAPPPQYKVNLLQPALELIRRQAHRLDVVETLQLLPPLVAAQDVKAFLFDTLRQPVFDTRILREVFRARSEQVERRLLVLENKRVKITDARICPQCHKRLGNSVIAVHVPRGEVTHYQCREAFARSLHH